ncbi:ArsR family transcriptional regulator [Roseibium hamelinense]|uniref:ArsR family transcriptional regulator n=1 Tax=Roseibium hamelinense TaxID=150831 RepID=A0A562SLK1_9HYPH|nr:helix-turn-helix domain-containing protein [Roseibium hamelinense]MTI44916.1 ArsR family transcriptional regulator [Roseibium hamelinense]TWI82177.1 ArsR family transcriptional regulator [Roseibium hamelinense]
MKKEDALNALAALGQETRLDVFRVLVRAGAEGMTAGAIAEALDVRANTMSTHLAVLARTGLIRSQRKGRSIVYFTDLGIMQGLVTYLLEDCCGGNPELCAPLIELVDGSRRKAGC